MFDFDNLSSEVTISPLPSNQAITFAFDVNSRPEFLKNKVDRRNVLASRLERLMNEPTIGGHPFIRYIFEHVEEIDPEELLKVAKALTKVAEIIGPFNKIDAEVKGLAFVHQNINLVACAFGDFQSPDSDFFIDPITLENNAT